MKHIDREIHEPARLGIMTLLSSADWTDFASMCVMLRLTRGNLSSHIARLERRGYVQIKKSIVGKIPHTEYRLTRSGRHALNGYWSAIDAIRKLANA
jgi:DNA-binding MarR family transcriptional regulator